MSPELANTVIVGIGLNRAGRGEEAESVVLNLIVGRGPSSETYGILGRIYKDRWDFATLLELAVLGKDEAGAADALAYSLAAVRESWEPETTLRNLRLIREARQRRGKTIPLWISEIAHA